MSQHSDFKRSNCRRGPDDTTNSRRSKWRPRRHTRTTDTTQALFRRGRSHVRRFALSNSECRLRKCREKNRHIGLSLIRERETEKKKKGETKMPSPQPSPLPPPPFLRAGRSPKVSDRGVSVVLQHFGDHAHTARKKASTRNEKKGSLCRVTRGGVAVRITSCGILTSKAFLKAVGVVGRQFVLEGQRTQVFPFSQRRGGERLNPFLWLRPLHVLLKRYLMSLLNT